MKKKKTQGKENQTTGIESEVKKFWLDETSDQFNASVWLVVNAALGCQATETSPFSPLSNTLIQHSEMAFDWLSLQGFINVTVLPDKNDLIITFLNELQLLTTKLLVTLISKTLLWYSTHFQTRHNITNVSNNIKKCKKGF